MKKLFVLALSTGLIAIFLVSNNMITISSIFPQLDKSNWPKVETNVVTFQYPPEWQLQLNPPTTTSKSNIYDFRLMDPITNTFFIGFTGKIISGYLQEDPELYFNSFLNGVTSGKFDTYSLESYPYGEITIGELPTYSGLYSINLESIIGKRYSIFISMAFDDDKTKYYSIMFGCPKSEYEKMEPIMFEMLKSIALKN